MRWTCWLALAAAAAGCQTKMPWDKPEAARPAAPIRPSVELDPCAERLGEICARMLMYWAVRRELPQRLEGLREAGGGPMPPLVCPASGRPYGYAPQGLPMPGSDKLILVYDTKPAHTGMRWTVAADPAGPGKPLVARVLMVPDNPALFPGDTPAPAPVNTPAPSSP